MEKDEELLWEGTISRAAKRRGLIIGTILFLIFLIAEIGIIFWNPEDIIWVILKFVLIILVGFPVILASLAFIFHFLDRYDRYFVTKNELIYKKVSVWGTYKTYQIVLDKIKIIHMHREYSSELNNFYFYTLSIDEINEEYHSKFQEYPTEGDFNLVESSPDFYFQWVDTPKKLLEVLQSLIPLKMNPTLPNTFERIE